MSERRTHTQNSMCLFARTQWPLFGLRSQMQSKTLDKQINAEEQKKNKKQ